MNDLTLDIYLTKGVLDYISEKTVILKILAKIKINLCLENAKINRSRLLEVKLSMLQMLCYLLQMLYFSEIKRF